MRLLLFSLLSLFLFSCGSENPQKTISVKDSSVKKDSSAKVVLKDNSDSIRIIDFIVAGIRKKISGNELRKKIMKGGMRSNEGMIYELYDGENLVYAYSDNEMEFGSEELECFFQNDNPVFCIVNRIKFGKNNSGEIVSDIRLKTASETIYFSNGSILQSKISTFTNENGWKKIPFENKIVDIIADIRAELIRNGAWEKRK